MQQLARDLKAELDKRDEEIRRTLDHAEERASQTLGDTIRKDEAPGHRKTRPLLDETRKQVPALQMQGHCKSRPEITVSQRKPRLPACRACKSCRVGKRNGLDPWQGSAWAVREGDRLGEYHQHHPD